MTRDEDGFITPMFVGLLMTLVVVLGLVIDFKALVNAGNRADDVAEAAAVAGADRPSEDGLRRGVVELDAPSAVNAAEDYLRELGYVGSARIVSSRRCEVGLPPPCTAVEVLVELEQRLNFLVAQGPTRTVNGKGLAIPLAGVVEGDR